MACPDTTLEVQLFNIVEGSDPSAHIYTLTGKDRKVANGQTARVVGGGDRPIRKYLHPRFNVAWVDPNLR